MAENRTPLADASATPTSGSAPLTVQFDGSSSSDPDGDPLSYAWDLDGDGSYDDANAVQPSWTYTAGGTVTAWLQVADGRGGSSTDGVTITVDAPPLPSITTPTASTTWRVGDMIPFSGEATDAEDGPLPPSALSWTLVQQHCPSNCHEHVVTSWPGVASGEFAAPDHAYPSYLQLRLTATDSTGTARMTSVDLQPNTVVLSFATQPTGLLLGVNAGSATAPFNRTVIEGSTNSVSAPSPQDVGGRRYEFVSWSDGGAQSHTVVAPASATTYTASFRQVDAFAPTAPTNLRASKLSGTSVRLTWTAATDDVGVMAYDVHRSTTSGFTPSAANLVQTVTGTSTTDSALSKGTYFYRVVARDASGKISPPSAQAKITLNGR